MPRAKPYKYAWKFKGKVRYFKTLAELKRFLKKEYPQKGEKGKLSYLKYIKI